jgi:hypothetical protein
VPTIVPVPDDEAPWTCMRLPRPQWKLGWGPTRFRFREPVLLGAASPREAGVGRPAGSGERRRAVE